MANVALIRFFAFFCGLLGVIFLITATPTHHWYHARPYGTNSTNHTAPKGVHVEEIYGGIFEDCKQFSDNSYTCISQKGDAYLKSTKACLIVGILLFAAVIVYTLLLSFTRGICYKVLGGLLVLTAFFIMVAMSIYTDQHSVEGDDAEYGWSFSLGWASFIFTLISGILSFFGSVEYETI